MVENPRNLTLMAFFELCQEHNFVKTQLDEDVCSYCTLDNLFKMFIFTKKYFHIQKVRYNSFNLGCLHLNKLADLCFYILRVGEL